MINDIYDYIESGFKVFGLHGASGGLCNCGDVECKAILAPNYEQLAKRAELV